MENTDNSVRGALLKRAFNAKSPEAFWGTCVLTQDNISTARMDEVIAIAKQALENQPENGMQNLLLYAHAIRFKSWAEEKLAKGTYGDEVEYRLEAVFEVVDLSNTGDLDKYTFRLVGLPENSYEEIPASVLKDYTHTDTYQLRDNQHKVYAQGLIMEEGTHIVIAYFDQQSPSPGRFRTIKAGSMTPGHQLVVRTWEYGSLEQLAKALDIHTQS